MSTTRKPPQLQPAPAGIDPKLAKALNDIRNAVLYVQGRVGTSATDAPVLKTEIEGLVKKYTGQAIDYPTVPQVILLDTKPVPGGVRITFNGSSYNYVGHSHIDIYRGEIDASFENADHIGRAEMGTFTDTPFESKKKFRYWFRSVNEIGDVGDWYEAAGTVLETGELTVQDIGGFDNHVGEFVNRQLLKKLDASKSWVGTNVNDWNSYVEGNSGALALGLQIKIDRDNQDVYIKFAGYDAASVVAQSIEFELEIFSSIVTAMTNVSADGDEIPTDKADVMNFEEDTGNQYGLNGLVVKGNGWSVTGATSDEIKLTLNELGPDTMFRLRITSVDAEDGYFTSLGDRVADQNFTPPIEYWFTASDAQEYDALRLANGPAEGGAERTGGHGTSELVDDASLGGTSHWAGIEDVPPTMAEHGITNGQEDLGPAPGSAYVLHRDSGGTPYWAAKYDMALNAAWNQVLDTDVTLTSSSAAYGRLIQIPNPGREVTLLVFGQVGAYQPVGTGRAFVGEVWGNTGGASFAITTRGTNGLPVENQTQSASMFGLWTGTPTGDIFLQMHARYAGPSTTVKLSAQDTGIAVIVLPNSNFSLDTGPVTCTVPSTATGNCSKAYTSGSTCTATANVTASVSGGTPGYTYAWTRASGVDAITSGSTSQTCTVSGTQTTADPSVSHNTTIYCTATDAVLTADQSNNCVVTLTYIRTFDPLVVSAPDKTFGCSGTYPGLCASGGDLTRSVSGGDGTYATTWTHLSGAGEIVSGSTSTSCTVNHHAGTGNNTTIEYVGTFRCAVNDGNGDSDTDDLTVKFRHTGWSGDS